MLSRMSLERNKRAALDSFRVIEDDDAALAERVVGAEFINREAEDDPEDVGRQERGPRGFLATARWLRAAFTGLRFEHQHVIAERDRVVVVTTMLGTHAGEFQKIAPTGRPIRQRQIHVFRLSEGRIVEHVAQRDDLGLLLQLGWRPPAA
jgi:predicted ester cyclase